MDKTKKLISTAAIGALALTLLIPSASFAADAGEDRKIIFNKKRTENSFQRMGPKPIGYTHEQIMELVNKYTPDLKDKFQEIHAKMTQVRELLKPDEETKAQMIEIRKQVKDGTITQEQAREKMEALGIKVPGKKGMRPEIDEETRQKLEENRQKLNEIRQKVKEGSLTREEAKTEMEALGFKEHQFERKGIENQMKDSIPGQLRQAVKNNDENQIKDLLNQLLSELQNKVQ